MIRWSILACINFLTSVIIRCAAAMRELEYNEDSSASCLPDCQGTYKSQHDTSQNLKYFYVFPKVAALEGGGGGGGKSSSSSSTSADAAPSLDTTSKEYLVVPADASTFQEMVQRKVTSWSQKKKLLELLKEKAEEFITISNKAMTKKLNPLEEEISNANSGCDEEKIAWLQSEIKGMVEKGQLTEKEKTEVLRYFFLYSSCLLKENQYFETKSFLSILYFSRFLFLFLFLFLNVFDFNM